MDSLSILAPLMRAASDVEASPLVEAARAAVRRHGAGSWDIQAGPIWCRVTPHEYAHRVQGWKLHVAATGASAPDVLATCLTVLLAHRCAFKFASTPEFARTLNSAHYPRGGAGKFLTAYPDDDEQLRAIAAELDQATEGLAGPAILSDRPYRPGSLVHYRYGGFEGGLVLGNDGAYTAQVQAPDGTWIDDRRDAWFAPPAGVSSPLPDPDPQPASGTAPPREPLLVDRYAVREAIRHANKGGVYRAHDTRTGADVVIKQARPHVEGDDTGWDVRAALRDEAEMLNRLWPLGVAPAKLETFEQGGHLFLAEELITGTPMRRWIAELGNSQAGLAHDQVVAVLTRLAELVATVHGAGIALRDLTPNNVILTETGVPRVVDLELAAEFGAPGRSSGTPGYGAPEQFAAATVAPEADLYSLGAIAFLLATGTDPVFGEDEPALRSTHARLADWLAHSAQACDTAEVLRPMILGLMEPAPDRRWSLDHTQQFLVTLRNAAAPSVEDPPPIRRGSSTQLTLDQQQRVVEDGVAHLLATITPDADWLWPTTCIGAMTEPCNVHHGAAGVLGVLVQASRVRGEAAPPVLHQVATWLERRAAAEPRVLPGLYFGRAGTAWALYDAASALGDDALAARAAALAKRLPLTWPNPDLTHGAAGAGLTQLHLWHATGDDAFADRLHRCADGLIETTTEGPGGIVWRVPETFDSLFAGSTYYGFAHGLAGIGWFLLAAGLATGRDDCLRLAHETGETLAAAAITDEGGAWWPEGPHDEYGRWTHWCHGSSGVGTFLLRLWQADGDERFRKLAEMAADAVHRARWQMSVASCHGLAGNGDYLLDLAEALGEPRYRAWAEEFAAMLYARRAYRHGRLVIPDETATDFAADYSGGLAGVLAFFLRLRYGGARMWMADPALVRAAR